MDHQALLYVPSQQEQSTHVGVPHRPENKSSELISDSSWYEDASLEHQK